MNTPNELKYATTHEWVRLEADGTATLGITDFAQHELGDVVYLELPEAGRALTSDEPFGTVESVKAVSDLVAPLNGEVVKVNTELVDSPEGINGDPYGSWMVVVKPSDPAELDALMTAEQYAAFTEEG